MSENKTGKYFKYAIGEIILVVIGILIALQINNWNEGEKSKTFEKETLTQIRTNLLKDKMTLSTFANNGDIAVKSISKVLKTDVSQTINDSIKFWLGRVIRFDRFSPLTSAFEVLKSKGIDQISNKKLRFLLGSYYDDKAIRISRACDDLESMFVNDWIPILKKNVVAQKFNAFVDLQNYEVLKPGGEVRNLLILNKDNWRGTTITLEEGVALIDEILSSINKELND